jgi:tRNA(Arg) A34 adenosine deaminase TadA
MQDKDFMKLAIEHAKKSLETGGFPAGAVIVKDGEMIAEGVSLGGKLNDPTEHAETSAIRIACKKLRTLDLSGATLYASLQPCLMCFSVANWAQISKIVYGCKKTDKMVKNGYYEGSNNINEINMNNNHQIDIEYLGDYENDSLELVKQWEPKSLQAHDR